MSKDKGKPNHPIDRIRDAAISMKIGPGDGAGGHEMVGVGKFLFIIRAHDIYKIILADNTDPGRTNPAVPNAQQKVCDFGAEDKVVGATLLTANRLIKSPTYYPKDFGVEEVLELVFNCTQELIGLKGIAEEIQQRIVAVSASFQPSADLLIPHTDHLAASLRTYFEKTKQLFMQWFELIKKFFPDVRDGQLTKLLEHCEKKNPEERQFISFLKDCIKYHSYMKHARDAVVHPKHDQRLDIQDFILLPNGKIMVPSFRLISRHIVDQEFYDVPDFLSNSPDQLIEYTEYLIAFLACYSPVALQSGFKRGLAQLPPGQQRNNVRLSYTTILDGQEIVLG